MTNSEPYINHHKIDYAILSAMPEELEFLLNQLSHCDSIKLKVGQFDFGVYTYQGYKILISYSGIGTSFASSILTLINSHFRPEYFFICGTAGGIKKHLQLRDVVIVEKAFEAEMLNLANLIKDTPFESCLTHPLKKEAFPLQYSASAELITICDSLMNENIFKGTVVSSNAFPAPIELFEKIKKLDPYAIDMETSAFYQTAWLLNIKILSVRGISNLLNSDGTDENVHESDVKGSSEAANKVLLTILNDLISL